MIRPLIRGARAADGDGDSDGEADSLGGAVVRKLGSGSGSADGRTGTAPRGRPATRCPTPGTRASRTAGTYRERWRRSGGGSDSVASGSGDGTSGTIAPSASGFTVGRVPELRPSGAMRGRRA